MAFTADFLLKSQSIRLFEGICQWTTIPQARTGVSPSRLSFSKVLGPGTYSTMLLQTTIRCTHEDKVWWVAQIHKVSFSLFSRPYWENHCYFLFLRLLICLNSAGSLTQFEIWLVGSLILRKILNTHFVPFAQWGEEQFYAVYNIQLVDNQKRDKTWQVTDRFKSFV